MARLHSIDKDSLSPGSGNAVMRPHRVDRGRSTKPWPRSIGIPTGWYPGTGPGFKTLAETHSDFGNTTAKQLIDDALRLLSNEIDTGDYTKVFYSAGDDGVSLGFHEACSATASNATEKFLHSHYPHKSSFLNVSNNSVRIPNIFLSSK